MQQGIIPAQDAERWLQQLEEANGVGEFHTEAIVFTAVGDKALVIDLDETCNREVHQPAGRDAVRDSAFRCVQDYQQRHEAAGVWKLSLIEVRIIYLQREQSERLRAVESVRSATVTILSGHQ